MSDWAGTGAAVAPSDWAGTGSVCSGPIKEQVVTAILAALAEISAANGYRCDGVTITRPRRTGERFSPKHLGISLVQGDEVRDEENENSSMHAWRLTVFLDLCYRTSEASAVAMDTGLNLLEADVRQALMADWRLGGLGWITLGPSVPAAGESGLEATSIELAVRYRTQYTNPYTQT